MLEFKMQYSKILSRLSFVNNINTKDISGIPLIHAAYTKVVCLYICAAVTLHSCHFD